MIDYLLDTNAVSELVRNPAGTLAEQVWREAPAVGTSIIVAGELRYGIAKRGSPRLAAVVEATLRSMPVLPLEQPVELHYATLRAALEAEGKPIGPNDLWIAAHALTLDCTLVTANEREFRRVPGLRLENWLKPADT